MNNNVPSLSDKIATAKARIQQAVQTHARPALMCSFGKDSMVLLHLARELGLNLPIIFHRDPWFPKKYAFATQVIQDWNLTVFDYPPLAVSLWYGKSIVAFNQHYQIGTHPNGAPVWLDLPKNIIEPELDADSLNRQSGPDYLCGLKDFFGRPTGTFKYPWDAVLIGHKSSDEDQIAGKVPLHVDVKQNAGAGPDAWFPLRDWTDADIWAYTEEHSVPVQLDRYLPAPGGGHYENPSKTANSDYWHACIRCIDKTQPAHVHCPKLGITVSNVSAQIPCSNATAEYFGEANSPSGSDPLSPLSPLRPLSPLGKQVACS